MIKGFEARKNEYEKQQSIKDIMLLLEKAPLERVKEILIFIQSYLS